MTRKALPSILLHKREVTYRDTGVSKKTLPNHNFSLNYAKNTIIILILVAQLPGSP